MKYMNQVGIILGITFLGEMIHSIIPLPIPASIYGLIIMLFCLYFKLVKVENVKQTGGFLIEIMPLMFIPAAVGLLTAWKDLKSIWITIIIITILTTIIVMAVTGKTVQAIISKDKDRKVERK
ncbi:CidA/LrgA family protein [Anaerocolumna sedimenticola]|uniref:CidA/LrgA family protein n=1 Tax=Anaerocolumna sedimenticola TaxID=2696063 RepID=A0A6P1TT87_9FIRM|nr:CidA/LrgA family protein [Anaerocolumna sedimenticola]QHQ63492.1 CidA/LrgA family protein [Anaerocolumna sedimenticola]